MRRRRRGGEEGGEEGGGERKGFNWLGGSCAYRGYIK